MDMYVLSFFVQTPRGEKSDSSPGSSTVTRTDDEINEDLGGLDSELMSGRDMTRQATLDLCFRQERDGGLMVEGQRFQDFTIDRSPLTKEKLMNIMHKKYVVLKTVLTFVSPYTFCASHKAWFTCHACPGIDIDTIIYEQFWCQV